MANHFKLKSSPKVYKNYKSDFPSRTILRAEKAFKKLGIRLNKLKYEWNKIGEEKILIYSGRLLYNNQYVSSGKGINYQLSKASAYSELIERIPVDLSSLTSCINLGIDIKKGSFLPGYSYGSQEEMDNTIDIKEFFTHFPLLNFKKYKKNDLFEHWVDAYSLTEDKYKKVPHLLIRRISGSNGCASGNTLEEAISQAFFEICERHSLIEHLLRKESIPTVDQNSIKNKTIHRAIELFNSMNIDVEIKDLTLGNKLPVMGVLFTNQNLAHEKNTLRKKLFFKTLIVGSHPDLNQALLRCFTEKIQLNIADIQTLMYHKELYILDQYFSKKEKEKIIEDFEKEIYSPLFSTGRSFDSFDYLNKFSPLISFGELLGHQTTDFLEDIKIIKDISEKNNWETLIIDYSVSELPLKVVRVIVPSVSDVLRFKYSPKTTYFFDEKNKTPLPEVFVKSNKSKGINIEKLTSVLENHLAQNIIWPRPQENSFSPQKILFLLSAVYLLKKEYKKSRHILKLLNDTQGPSGDNFDITSFIKE